MSTSDLNENERDWKKKIEFYIKHLNNWELIEKKETKWDNDHHQISRYMNKTIFKDGVIVKYVDEYSNRFPSQPKFILKRYYILIDN